MKFTLFERASRPLRSWLLFLLILIAGVKPVQAQHDVPRLWSEVLLEAIRSDFARPTVHARNLFHTSVALYDAWAVYDDSAETYFLGKTVGNYTCVFNGIESPLDVKAAREEVMSFAAYRLLSHRFRNSPGKQISQFRFDTLFVGLGYDSSFHSTDYSGGRPAALGNYLAESLIQHGLDDGSNEQNDYGNLFYNEVNDPLLPMYPGNPDISDPNRWQPLTLDVFVDQSGNVFPINTPDFLSPEWGQVTPFSLKEDDLDVFTRDGDDYWVYHDPGVPPYLSETSGSLIEEYQWGFALVSIWSAHLDPADSVKWDISPGNIGNMGGMENYPKTFEEHRSFYDLIEGGDPSMGHDLNPATGQPYEPQFVPRGDYGRVLAEFWADGPDSETPPGHWFTILNYVMDHPNFEPKFEGAGEDLDLMEYEVKAYLTLGGAMHDVGITAWGIKGWYDYIRPISAIRCMSDIGQSTDTTLSNYDPRGIPLEPGYIEIVQEGDALAGANNINVGKIKVYAWRGPDYITNEETDVAGVGWILAEDWWPYQRPSFVTPPFAGYVSGHSVFSRAAAEVMTLITGDAFFPGGMGEFVAPKDEFLVFEDGPSVDVTLQWATYRDASDQTSLSRIWGGIHPPADDLPGRHIGETIGVDAFAFAKDYFTGVVTSVQEPASAKPVNFFPNPVEGRRLHVQVHEKHDELSVQLLTTQGRVIKTWTLSCANKLISLEGVDAGTYVIKVIDDQWEYTDLIHMP